MEQDTTLPRWNLDPIYPGFSSAEYSDAKSEFQKLAADFERHCATPPGAGAFRTWLLEALRLSNTAGALGETLGAFAYTSYSVNTRDTTAMNELNAVEEMALALDRKSVV